MIKKYIIIAVTYIALFFACYVFGKELEDIKNKKHKKKEEDQDGQDS